MSGSKSAESNITSQFPDYLLVAGRRVQVDGLDHVNPSTGRVQAKVPMGTPELVNEAVAAARAALPVWRALPSSQRQQKLRCLMELVRDQREEFEMLATLELGLPIRYGPTLVDYGLTWFEDAIGWSSRLFGDTLPVADGFDYSLAEPIGVVGVLTTWNGSSSSFGMAVAPALAAGCTVVIKPSEIAPFGMIRVAALCAQAGIPDGVVNVVPGDVTVGQALVGHPGVDKISFTGGRGTAQRIAVSCAETLKPAVLELGGKSPVLVFDDSDLEAAISASLFVAFNSGQSCTLGSRLIVQRTIFERFVDGLVEASSYITLGDPRDPDTMMGPVVNQVACDRIMGILGRLGPDEAVLAGGARRAGDLAAGFFIEPTVVATRNESEIASEEVFGPVLAVIPFDDEEEAIALANETPYGLAAYAFTADLNRAMRMVTQLDAGNVGVNGGGAPGAVQLPFGGRKQSGYGRQGGLAGVMEFVSMKTVQIKLT